MTNANPWFVPDFRVAIDGQPVPVALRASIMSVHCQSGIEGADRVEIALVNENLRSFRSRQRIIAFSWLCS